ncbi:MULTISPECIES: TerC family protein [Clostridium]|uniref:TerC family protein n=1 Tax=Clostridium TaxID=1485 RepID=UPI00069E3A0A|nr:MULTISPECIES: TerC family protein [Clostridium]KOF57812.1 membrane protein [Clostridium sp. DMHC 10]MCD2348624.1 TerC family protein [Clostridium guangxiense]
MSNFISIIGGALQITLLDIVLSGDNIGVIALATRDLPKKLAKKASVIGVTAAVLLRIIFACLVTYILMIQWLPIKLVGGLLLIKITWDFIKPEENTDNKVVHSSQKLWSAVTSIILADITMSLDNVLAIAGAAAGNIFLIIFGLLLNIPIIFLGSQYVARLMQKHKIVIYIGGAILAHTAFSMLLNDNIVKSRVPYALVQYFPYITAIIVFLYGIYMVVKSPKNNNISEEHKESAVDKTRN